MKAAFELIGKSFFFAGPLSLTKGQPPVELELSETDDAFLRCAAFSTHCAILKSTATPVQIIDHIRDGHARNDALVSLGLPVDVKKGEFRDVLQVAPVVIEAEVETATEPAASQADVTEQEEGSDEDDQYESSDFSDLDVSDESLERILKGSNNAVMYKLEQASLSTQDKERLLKLEKEGKNRRVVLAVIERLK